jgi:hypothetical protein
VKTSLLMRGFRESRSALPDTVRRHGGRMLMDIAAGYNKKIARLERNERDIKLEVAAIDRKTAQAAARKRTTVMPIAAGGMVMLLVGVVLAFVPARRVDA